MRKAMDMRELSNEQMVAGWTYEPTILYEAIKTERLHSRIVNIIIIRPARKVTQVLQWPYTSVLSFHLTTWCDTTHIAILHNDH